MRDIDEIDRMFRMLRDMMGGEFSGGYTTERSSSNYNEKADIQEDEDKIYITMELKVQEEDIQVTPLEDKVVIEVMLDGTWTRNNLKLSSPIDPKSSKISFKNNVLDIQLNKVKKDGINAKL